MWGIFLTEYSYFQMTKTNRNSPALREFMLCKMWFFRLCFGPEDSNLQVAYDSILRVKTNNSL